jgi:hypothetical protein
MYTHNQQKILECREALSKAIWKRDALRNDFSRRLDELKADLETLTVPVIADKAEKWQKDLSALQGQRLVEQIETFRDKGNDKLPKLVRFKSNFAVINEAREALTAAIRELRAMRTRPLPEIWTFIEAQEARLRLFDFGVLVEAAQPVPESTFAQLAEGPEMLIRPKDGEIARAFEIYFDPGAPAGGRPHTKRGK